jgi:hypothetical protein
VHVPGGANLTQPRRSRRSSATRAVLNGAAEEVRTGRLDPDGITAILLPAFTDTTAPRGH